MLRTIIGALAGSIYEFGQTKQHKKIDVKNEIIKDNALSFGGDTDTNACIVGSMAEAFYGIDENLKQSALNKLPRNLLI